MSVGTVTEGTIPFDLPRDEAQAIRVTLRSSADYDHVRHVAKPRRLGRGDAVKSIP
jgi:hypothetical protein